MESLSFAVVAKSAESHGLASDFCRRLQALTAIAIQPRVLGSYAEMLGRLQTGQVELAWTPPLVAMKLEDESAARLLVVVQRKYTAGYHSALFVRTDSGLKTVEDLDRATVAWVSHQSASGYFVPRWQLRSRGIDLRRAFGRELFFPNHQAVARAVCSGEANVGATHVALDPVSGRLASAPWQPLINQSRIRVLLLVGPIPGDGIAARSDVPADTRRQLTAALLALRPDDAAVGPLFDATSFEPVPDGHLALLRRLSRFAASTFAMDHDELDPGPTGHLR